MPFDLQLVWWIRSSRLEREEIVLRDRGLFCRGDEAVQLCQINRSDLGRLDADRATVGPEIDESRAVAKHCGATQCGCPAMAVFFSQTAGFTNTIAPGK
jgi:hypothetical protein